MKWADEEKIKQEEAKTGMMTTFTVIAILPFKLRSLITIIIIIIVNPLHSFIPPTSRKIQENATNNKQSPNTPTTTPKSLLDPSFVSDTGSHFSHLFCWLF